MKCWPPRLPGEPDVQGPGAAAGVWVGGYLSVVGGRTVQGPEAIGPSYLTSPLSGLGRG